MRRGDNLIPPSRQWFHKHLSGYFPNKVRTNQLRCGRLEPQDSSGGTTNDWPNCRGSAYRATCRTSSIKTILYERYYQLVRPLSSVAFMSPRKAWYLDYQQGTSICSSWERRSSASDINTTRLDPTSTIWLKSLDSMISWVIRIGRFIVKSTTFGFIRSHGVKKNSFQEVHDEWSKRMISLIISSLFFWISLPASRDGLRDLFNWDVSWFQTLRKNSTFFKI